MFGIFAALAEFERELIRERTLAGLKAARARGRKGGRKFALSKAQVRLAQAAMAHRDTSVSELCRELDLALADLFVLRDQDPAPSADLGEPLDGSRRQPADCGLFGVDLADESFMLTVTCETLFPSALGAGPRRASRLTLEGLNGNRRTASMSIACELGNGRNVFLLCRLAGRIPISSLATLICVAALGCGDGGRTPSSPTAPTTSPPVAQSIAINLDVEDLTVGQTVTLTATVTLSDGSRRPVTDGAWESDNSDVAFLETTTGEEVLLRAVGAGSATLSVESGGQRGTRAVTVLPPLVIDGTLYVDADIVTSSDPTTFRNASYAGRGDRVMFDRRQNAFVTYNAFLFDATFTDGFSVEIQVNPEFQTREAAQQEADKYGGLIGQLPRALRQPEFQTVWIHRGIEPFGGGNNNVLIHTGEADQLEAQGFLEEVFIHEATHTTLDARHASSSGWIQAQGNDMNFISTYARDHPMREDLAESFPMWMALRYREGRISSRLAATIRTRMPHRIAYLDDQNFDMAPVR